MGGLQRNQDLFGALQWSSTREDLFPQSLCECLGRLHDRAPQHSYKQTRKVILEQFNRPIEDIFDEFPTTPSASGSIAQVNCCWWGSSFQVDESIGMWEQISKRQIIGVFCYIDQKSKSWYWFCRCLEFFLDRCTELNWRIVVMAPLWMLQ